MNTEKWLSNEYRCKDKKKVLCLAFTEEEEESF